jgi:tRNA nucleotidyltransferase (CCA-adding enzyme)
MKIEIPENARKILDTIHKAGYEAYVVGGCVRDSILGRTPGDWDITTSAKPQQIKKLFKRTIDTGIEHGTVTVMMNHEGYEVTTYRIDGEYADNRHPKEVTFTASLTEDMKRRDFTINAMAYNDEEGLIDRFTKTVGSRLQFSCGSLRYENNCNLRWSGVWKNFLARK